MAAGVRLNRLEEEALQAEDSAGGRCTVELWDVAPPGAASAAAAAAAAAAVDGLRDESRPRRHHHPRPVGQPRVGFWSGAWRMVRVPMQVAMSLTLPLVSNR